jgi:3-hydroxyacyl-CoA dehydrogenase
VNRLQYGLLGEAFRLVQDNVIGAADLDLAISAGLGLRWSFMGPFQTIDLNAPHGVEDYCNKFANAIMAVMKTEDNSRNCFTPDVVEKITKEMRAQVPLERLKQREAWRNARLARLAVHKQEQETEGVVTASSAGGYLNRMMGLHGQVNQTTLTSTETLKTTFLEVVLVTGGTGVLGRAMAVGLASVGARVILLGRNEQKAAEAVSAVKAQVPSGDVSYQIADVLQRSQLEAVSTRVLASHGGRIDVLVNAAGGNLPQATLPVEKSVFDLSENAFREVTELNLLGTVLPTLVFGAVFAKQGSGVRFLLLFFLPSHSPFC